MNRNKLKAYAPKARRDFIKAVTDRAAFYGLTKDKIEPISEQGDVAIIAGKPFSKDVARKRKWLEERIRRDGFEQVMEAMAYTWFNRFVAIRFMELHGYLEHGYRILSTTDFTDDTEVKDKKRGTTNSTNDTNKGGTGSGLPKILVYAEHVDLRGLDREKVVELKLAGNRDEELYRMLLVAQCNALHKAMPFLFEEIGNATELLLPENLLHSDSLIRRMVNEIPEEEWENVEIIGWLYQFYISEKKDQVIGKVVKSEDIPAATQLFTPNWIVKYMVQNTLGRQWVATYPNSQLKQRMEYYIEPSEQTSEVQEQLRAITPESLNPEKLTLLDPACGSGHILVEAYDLFKAIYQERGYRAKDITKLILEKNLYGLEIDDRAAQLASFALMMKGRADDRRIFERGIRFHVLTIQETKGMDAQKITQALNAPIIKGDLPPRETLFEEMDDARAPLFGRKNLSVKGEISQDDVAQLIQLFEQGKTFGSLIRVPENMHEKLVAITERVEDVLTYGDMFGKAAAGPMIPIVEQAELLAAQYDAVVANPPYMGGNGMNALVKKFAKDHFPDAKSDLFACFIERAKTLANCLGAVGIVAPYVWMFLPSYQRLRKKVLSESNLSSLIQLEYNAFEPACIPVATFTLSLHDISNYSGRYVKLSQFRGHQNQAPRTLQAISNPNCGWIYSARADDFRKIPGWPIAYWISPKIGDIFQRSEPLSEKAEPKNGLQTSDNERFLRLWYEVAVKAIGFGLRSREQAKFSKLTWFPTNKGGNFRKWYGNHDFVVNWFNDGEEIFDFRPNSVIRNPNYYFHDAVSWSDVTSSINAFRYYPEGFIHNITAPSAFGGNQKWKFSLAAFCNNKFVSEIAHVLNPSMHFTTGDFGNLPNASMGQSESQNTLGATCVRLASDDWNIYERSWDFQSFPLLTDSSEPTSTLESSYTVWTRENRDTIAEMKRLEEENNCLFIDAYGLADELTPDVPIEQITLTVNPAYRYGGKLTEEEQWTRFRQDTMAELVSYAIGCMMGRYSLDAPGLTYAHSGNKQFWEIYHQKHNKSVSSKDNKNQCNPCNPWSSSFNQNKNHSFNSCDSWSTFPPDQDGIIPITDTDRFPDDAANRFIEFISVAWPKEHLEENLKFVAESLGPKRGESPRETIRRYISTGFFKHHLKTYKKRPIYWLFSSGKLRAFQCLVYLHRYNEGTLSRMRTEYVIPLQGKIPARIEQLSGDINAATSTAHRKKLEREKDKLVKQQTELQAFDEKLRHYADQRINLDLDDGVKVNYGKFGDLLAEVKAVTGKK